MIPIRIKHKEKSNRGGYSGQVYKYMAGMPSKCAGGDAGNTGFESLGLESMLASMLAGTWPPLALTRPDQPKQKPATNYSLGGEEASRSKYTSRVSPPPPTPTPRDVDQRAPAAAQAQPGEREQRPEWRARFVAAPDGIRDNENAAQSHNGEIIMRLLQKDEHVSDVQVPSSKESHEHQQPPSRLALEVPEARPSAPAPPEHSRTLHGPTNQYSGQTSGSERATVVVVPHGTVTPRTNTPAAAPAPSPAAVPAPSPAAAPAPSPAAAPAPAPSPTAASAPSPAAAPSPTAAAAPALAPSSTAAPAPSPGAAPAPSLAAAPAPSTAAAPVPSPAAAPVPSPAAAPAPSPAAAPAPFPAASPAAAPTPSPAAAPTAAPAPSAAPSPAAGPTPTTTPVPKQAPSSSIEESRYSDNQLLVEVENHQRRGDEACAARAAAPPPRRPRAAASSSDEYTPPRGASKAPKPKKMRKEPPAEAGAPPPRARRPRRNKTNTLRDYRLSAFKEKLQTFLRLKYKKNMDAEEMKTRLLGRTYEKESFADEEQLACEECVQIAVTRVWAPVPCSRLLRAALHRRLPAAFFQCLTADSPAAFTHVSHVTCRPGEAPMTEYSFRGGEDAVRELDEQVERMRDKQEALERLGARLDERLQAALRARAARAGAAAGGADADVARRLPVAALGDFDRLDELLRTSAAHRAALMAAYRRATRAAHTSWEVIVAVMRLTLAPHMDDEFSGSGRAYRGRRKRDYSATQPFGCLRDLLMEKFGKRLTQTHLHNLRNRVGQWLCNKTDRHYVDDAP